MSFGSRLKEKRESLGITQPQLAKLLNVSKGAIGNWETDVNSPRATLLYDLFDILHCDANYLFQDETKDLYKDEATPDEFEKIIKKYRTLDTYGKDAVDSVLDIEYTRCQVKEEPSSYIPDNIRSIDYYMKNASAGNGQVVFDDTVVERITIPDIPKYKRVAYAIGVNGNSMEPLYHDGDMLLIEPTVDMEIGEIGIFIVDGEAYVKKLGDKELISLNENYSDIPLTEYTSCMGRVVDKLPRE